MKLLIPILFASAQVFAQQISSPWSPASQPYDPFGDNQQQENQKKEKEEEKKEKTVEEVNQDSIGQQLQLLRQEQSGAQGRPTQLDRLREAQRGESNSGGSTNSTTTKNDEKAPL